MADLVVVVTLFHPRQRRASDRVFEDLAAAGGAARRAGRRDSLVRALALRDQLDARIAEAAGVLRGLRPVGSRCLGVDDRLAAGPCPDDHPFGQVAGLGGHAEVSLPGCARAYADGTLSGGEIEAIVTRLDDELAEVPPPRRRSWFPTWSR